MTYGPTRRAFVASVGTVSVGGCVGAGAANESGPVIEVEDYGTTRYIEEMEIRGREGITRLGLIGPGPHYIDLELPTSPPEIPDRYILMLNGEQEYVVAPPAGEHSTSLKVDASRPAEYTEIIVHKGGESTRGAFREDDEVTVTGGQILDRVPISLSPAGGDQR